ncbi:MAG: ArsR family transcriptional regulator [Lachnospiraceae bacterium]|nr:ArsR family transcriptional regulator [Lachnospiraceae bacterium]
MNEYSEKIQYAVESIYLLNDLGQVFSKGAPYMKERLDNLAKKNNLTVTKEMEEIGNLLVTIEEKAAKELSGEKEEILFYFREGKESLKSFGNLLLLSDEIVMSGHWKTTTTLYKYLKGLSMQEYTNAFYAVLRSYAGGTNRDEDDDGDYTYVDVLDAIDQMQEVSDNEKLRLQQLYLHYEEHLEKVQPILKKAETVIKGFEKQLEAYGKKTISFLKKTVGEEPFLLYLLRNVQHQQVLPAITKPSQVQVYYLHCTVMGAKLEGKTIETAVGTASVGVMFGAGVSLEELMASRDLMEEEKAQTILKLLADKSKFTILSMTGKEPAYGAQLAAKLGLSTATISHHTSALMDEGLLTIDKVDTKIYYRANQEMLRNLLTYLEQTLL